MPLYETNYAEKHAVVLDLGIRYTKFGFAGEDSPRCIIPTEIPDPETRQVRSIYSYKDETDLYSLLVEFIHMLHFKHILVSPKDRRVLILESLLCPTVFRDVLAKVLFRHFEVSSVLFVPVHLVAMSTLGSPGSGTGLVVDVGHSETLLIPVYCGVPVLAAWQAQPWAGKAVQLRLRESLVEHFKNGDSTTSPDDIQELTEETIEDIKVRACFVTPLERARKFADKSTDVKAAPDVSYRVGGSRLITIPGYIRETCHEVFFERDSDQLSLPNMILDAIVKCNVDMRKQLAENIFLIGGSSMTPGFKYRLSQELKHLIATPYYANRLKINKFKFHASRVKENYVGWLGGSLFGASDLLSVRSLTREGYLNNATVPDWCNLMYNTKSNAGSIKKII
ncbi:actin-related protein 10 [Nilaparvata lugens]|uniref:actin-related protein 10 n=1 Tax=Nilaparvata lugens TaxID=108931 RepID=UPI00193E014D|nr:actin-related protein 10 [Nilaparvata lugens]